MSTPTVVTNPPLAPMTEEEAVKNASGSSKPYTDPSDEVKATGNNLQREVIHRTQQTLHEANTTIRRNTWTSVGAAFSLGLVIGWLARSTR